MCSSLTAGDHRPAARRSTILVAVPATVIFIRRRDSFRTDAGYCLLLGLAFLFAAPYVADVIPLPVTAIAILGGVVIR